MVCTSKRIEILSGNRSQIIRDLINRKIRNIETKKEEEKIKQNKTANQILLDLNKAKFKYEQLRKESENFARSNNYSLCDNYNEKSLNRFSFTPKHKDCYVKNCDIEELQRASDLFALGKHKEAQKIWDSLIKLYQLEK